MNLEKFEFKPQKINYTFKRTIIKTLTLLSNILYFKIQYIYIFFLTKKQKYNFLIF